MKRFQKCCSIACLLTIILLTGCKKENPNALNFQPKRVRYEISASGNLEQNVFVGYIGRNNPEGGYNPNDIVSLNTTTTLPWSYEYNTTANKTSALLYVTNFDNSDIEITARILVDGVVVEEKTDKTYIELYHRLDY